MKTSIANFLVGKISAGIHWRYASRHFGKAFWILTLACVSCTANLSAPIMPPVTGAEANLAFLPEQVDFGIQALGTPSAAQTVVIRNDSPDPLKIDKVSVSTGFFLTENSFTQLPGAIASQKTCVVKVVFAPNISGNWVGYLQVNANSGDVMKMQIKGTTRSEMDGMAFNFP